MKEFRSFTLFDWETEAIKVEYDFAEDTLDMRVSFGEGEFDGWVSFREDSLRILHKKLGEILDE